MSEDAFMSHWKVCGMYEPVNSLKHCWITCSVYYVIMTLFIRGLSDGVHHTFTAAKFLQIILLH